MKIKKIRILTLALALLLLVSGCAAKQEAPAETPQDAAIPIETVKTDDFSMDYFHFGQGEKTLVILPGLGVQSVMGSAEAVAQAYQPLTDEFTIYLFERRNELPDSYTVYDMARDTAEAIRAVGLKDVNIFGASLGGMIAMDLAIEHPELVQKLVLASTSACLTDEQYQPIANWVELAKAGNAEDLYLAFGEAIYPQEVFEASRELLTAAAETVTDADLARFVILAEGMQGFDVAEKLDKIACPVLAIGSQDDQLLGAGATELIAERLNGRPDFEVYMYDGYGHAAYDTAPDYKDRLLQFFAAD